MLFLKQNMHKIRYKTAMPINIISDGINAKNLITANVRMQRKAITAIFCHNVNLTKNSLFKKLSRIVA